MFELSDPQKLLILASCAGLVSATILATVCVVTPHCWIYNCIWGKRDRERRRKLLYGTDIIPLPSCPLPVTPVLKTDLPITPISPQQGAGKNTRDSTYSSMSTSSKGETSVYSETSLDGHVANDESDAVYGHVTLTVKIQNQTSTSPQNSLSVGHLIINLREAQDLPPRQYGGTCDPYVIIRILKGKRKKRPSRRGGLQKLCQYKSEIKKRTQHPLFNEPFVIELSRSDLKDCSLNVLAYDMDKYANDSLLGEATVAFKDLDVLESPDEKILTLDLKEPRQYHGEILFGLSYLPTAERLTFSIMKASNLNSPFNNVELFYPCVRILLFHNGKLLKKKKTAPRKGTNNPVFNESLTFDIPHAEVDSVAFLLVLSHRDPNQGGALSSPETPTSPPGTKTDHHVGKLVVGSSGRGNVLHHWNAMKQSPRKQVTQWHTLR